MQSLDSKIRDATARCARDLADVIARGVRERIAQVRIERALEPLAPEARTRVMRAAVVLHQPRALPPAAPAAPAARRVMHCSQCRKAGHDRRSCPDRLRALAAARP